MAQRVVWTAKASKTYEYIFTCSRSFYSENVLKKLNSNLKKVEFELQDNPLLGAVEPIMESAEVEFRRIVLVRPFKLLYFVHNDIVYIADIWDTRQAPENLVKNIL